MDKLIGEDRDELKLHLGITGPAKLKYRLEDEMIASGDTSYAGTDNRNFCKENGIQTLFVKSG